MDMGDTMGEFIREQKSRVTEDKARLQKDPPYMDTKTKHRRAYASAVKENIPPNGVIQGKEESCSVGLQQLGVEYERKKQRLQHELRLDYRLYMAQKKRSDPAEPAQLLDVNRRPVRQHLTYGKNGFPQQRAPSRRDAATLTEDNKGRQRALHPNEEEEEEQSQPALRQRDRQGKPVEPGSEGDEDVKKQLDGMEVRRRRITAAEVNHEKRYINRTDRREKKDNLLSLAKDDRRWRTLTKQEDSEFTTGLIIGAADTVEAVQRKKEHYRQELEEQIAEQHRNKRKEKHLELKDAATGENDPEKQLDRIRQFGLSRRKYLPVLELSVTAENESSSSRGFHSHKKMMVQGRDTPPPDQPQVAFQSPLLANSSALGFSPSSQAAMDTPRIPVFHPYPPSTLSEAYRNLYAEPHYSFTNRNQLEPNMAYNDHRLSVPETLFLPSSHWNMPSGGAVPSPHSPPSGSSFPEQQILPSSAAAAAALDSHAMVFPAEKSRSDRERILSYRNALKEQIQEQQERRRLEMQERERLETELEADMRNHQPWGRGGGGAPLRDGTGNLIADLNWMHKLNEEAYANPGQWQRRTMATVNVSLAPGDHRPPEPSERLSGFTHVHTPQFARGKVFPNQPTQQQLLEQDKYKACLKQQIEEKMLKKAEEREKIRLEEEREEKRLAEQRARIQREYEEEQDKKRRKEMEQKANNEELVHLVAQRKEEAENKNKEKNAKLRGQCEQERRALAEVHREPSPPIPTRQKRHGPHQYTPRPPFADNQHSAARLSERSLSGLQSPPVPACRNQLQAAACEQRCVVSELSALRRQLHYEKKRLEGRLQMDDWEELDSLPGDRLQERPPVDVFDMARLRLQAPVRRPSSRNREPRNLLRIHDSLQLKSPDGKWRLGTSEVSQQDDRDVSSRRRQGNWVPFQPLGSQRSTALDDYPDLPPQHQRDYQRKAMVLSARGSLLESDSAFINPLGDALPSPQLPGFQKSQRLLARERRRLNKQPQHPQEPVSSSQHEHDTHTRLQKDQDHSSDGKSRNRTGHLMETPSRRGLGPVGLSDDDWSPQFSPDNLNHQSSTETVTTSPIP